MTRAEAIALANAAMHAPDGVTWAQSLEDADRQIAENRRAVERFVDAAAALGMLKLDEHKSAFDKFRAAMDGLQYKENSVVWRDIPVALDVAGLKIVEK